MNLSKLQILIIYNKRDISFTCLIHLVNKLISEGVIAIVGPKTSVAVKATHSLCSKFHIPQISASATDRDFYYNSEHYNYLLRMSPDDIKMNFAMESLIKYYKWERMGILTSATLYGKALLFHS